MLAPQRGRDGCLRSLDGSVQAHRCCYLPPFSHVGALVQHSSIYVAVTRHTTQLPRFEIPAHHRTCQVLNSHTHAKVKQLLSPRQSRGFSLRNKLEKLLRSASAPRTAMPPAIRCQTACIAPSAGSFALFKSTSRYRSHHTCTFGGAVLAAWSM